MTSFAGAFRVVLLDRCRLWAPTKVRVQPDIYLRRHPAQISGCSRPSQGRFPFGAGAHYFKCLEKDRNLRYQHASEIRTDLQRLKRDTDSGRSAAVHEPRRDLAAALPRERGDCLQRRRRLRLRQVDRIYPQRRRPALVSAHLVGAHRCNAPTHGAWHRVFTCLRTTP